MIDNPNHNPHKEAILQTRRSACRDYMKTHKISDLRLCITEHNGCLLLTDQHGDVVSKTTNVTVSSSEDDATMAQIEFIVTGKENG